MLKRNRIQAQSDESASPLLKLPGELRNRIYCYASVSYTPISIEADHFNRLILPGTPPLMLTCRKLYHEIKRIYYEDNTFCFTDSALNSTVVKQFGIMCDESAACLKSLEVFHGGNHFALLWLKPKDGVIIDIPALTRREGIRRAFSPQD